ncbi:unnamed protein product [Cylindrotheca closterium]|uniref:Uncharacterized protein n=1 Tax=Cylindrotheca closterium TaxID=2856 RepID=A0AAD2JGB6_9STRA|nr:unnamed protein product [Cylindrotheca closterium]
MSPNNNNNGNIAYTSSSTDQCSVDERRYSSFPPSSAAPSLFSLLANTFESQSPIPLFSDNDDESEGTDRQRLCDILSSALDVVGEDSSIYGDSTFAFGSTKRTSSSLNSQQDHSSPKQ